MAQQLKADNKNPVENRFEIIFLYDVEEGNPNGDPIEENKPRMDETTGENLVTDVRLKRTVRDYFIQQHKDNDGEEGTEDTQQDYVFVRQVWRDDGHLKNREGLVEDALGVEDLSNVKKEFNLESEKKAQEKIQDELLRQFIDLRLFGATVSVKDTPVSFTGPVQFKIGRSMHKVDKRFFRNSVTLPGNKDRKEKNLKTEGTFGQRYDLPYSLIRFYGIVNENAAQHTNLTRGDVYKLAEGLWNGTKSLITHSKMSHSPKVLIMVEYSEDNYHIGGLDHLIDWDSQKGPKELRTFNDLELDSSQLRERLKKHSAKIKQVHVQSETALGFENSLEVEDGDNVSITKLNLEGQGQE
jgi:CRISPR-associated protein Csh2